MAFLKKQKINKTFFNVSENRHLAGGGGVLPHSTQNGPFPAFPDC